MAEWTLYLGDGVLPPRELIGGKAWSIARMANLELPVPPAFVLTTHACLAYLESGLPSGLEAEVANGIAWLEKCTGRTYGRGPSPLLVSVRSGAAISMPGMMDTVLNMGITLETERALAAETEDPKFAHDVHRRFYELYSNIVLCTPSARFDVDGSVEDWEAEIERVKGKTIPADPMERLTAAICAVFNSWNSRRAKRYRKYNGISDDLGTAVTIQTMVFGNLSKTSGTGVAFSRNPISGVNEVYGEYLPCAQGEDVVSGRYTPQSIEIMRDSVPEAHSALLRAAEILDQANGDMQDIEFTVQNGELFLLQSRAAKRAAAAAVRCAVDMVDAGIINTETALQRVTPEQVRNLLAPCLADGVAEQATVLAKGQSACPGVGIGVLVTDPDEAEKMAADGTPVVLARTTTSPEDLHGMLVAKAVITEKGGSTSHAAVVSRAIGVPCVTGCGENSVTNLEGKWITVDGTTGTVYDGMLKVITPSEDQDERLFALKRMAESRASIRVLPTLSSSDPLFVNLNGVDGGDDVAKLPMLLMGATSASGTILASDEGMAAALAAGIKTVIGTPTLPFLLAASRVATAADQEAG